MLALTIWTTTSYFNDSKVKGTIFAINVTSGVSCLAGRTALSYSHATMPLCEPHVGYSNNEKPYHSSINSALVHCFEDLILPDRMAITTRKAPHYPLNPTKFSIIRLWLIPASQVTRTSQSSVRSVKSKSAPQVSRVLKKVPSRPAADTPLEVSA